MTTIKVKLRHSGVQGKAGTIYYQITHRRRTRRIATCLQIAPENWQSAAQCIAPAISQTPEGRLLRHCIERDVASLHRIVRELDSQGSSYEPDDIIMRFRIMEQRITVAEAMRREIDEQTNNNRLGTARNYRRALNSFMSFLGEKNVPFSAVTESLIDEYNGFLLQRGVVRNTISFYMRILRAVYNKAVRKYGIEQTYPFQHVYTGVDRTRQRAIDERLIAKLWRLDLTGAPSLSLARDFFVFSFCARGMAFVDMAHLQTKNIRDNEIVYTRRKTGQPLRIRIEPCMREIIVRHAAATYQSYLFPILRTTEPARAFSQYQTALNRYNQQLKELAKRLNLKESLSSYVARHSWATAARKHNIPLSVISAGMGHTSERTTQIYLASLENSAIDAANQKIMANLNKRVSTQETIDVDNRLVMKWVYFIKSLMVTFMKNINTNLLYR